MSGDGGAVEWTHYTEHPGVSSMLEYARTLSQHVGAMYTDSDIRTTAGVSSRNQLACWAFGVVHEHHSAIALLVETSHLGPAMALWRPIFEAFTRGLWLKNANAEEIKRFVEEMESLGPDKLLPAALKHANNQRYSSLLDTWNGAKLMLHGLTHHRHISLLSRSGEVDTDPNNVLSLLLTTTQMAVFAASETLALAVETEEVIALRRHYLGVERYLDNAAEAFAASL